MATKSNTQITDDVLDELVCGSLSPERYRLVLKQLETEPARWRDCALAFLQEQALESEMQALASSDVRWNPAEESLQPKPAPKSASLKRSLVAAQPSSSTTHHARDRARLLRLQQFTSLAAMILIAFTVGWIGSGMRGSSGPTVGPIAGPNIGTQAPEMLSTAKPEPGFEQPAPQNPPNQWPSGMQFASDRYVPLDQQMPESLQLLEQRGMIQIEVQAGLYPVELGDGTRVIMHTQHYHVIPTVQSY